MLCVDVVDSRRGVSASSLCVVAADKKSPHLNARVRTVVGEIEDIASQSSGRATQIQEPLL